MHDRNIGPAVAENVRAPRPTSNERYLVLVRGQGFVDSGNGAFETLDAAEEYAIQELTTAWIVVRVMSANHWSTVDALDKQKALRENTLPG
jgi:hypothetical protein